MTILTTAEIITRIAIAVGLGAILGLERTFAGKRAGMRTYAMVALGAAVFIIIAQNVIAGLASAVGANPLGVAGAIISGIGFIGAGLLIFHDNKVTGLTTAAGLWVSSAVGMASGFGFFSLATMTTVAALMVFTMFWFIEHGFLKFTSRKNSDYTDEDENGKK